MSSVEMDSSERERQRDRIREAAQARAISAGFCVGPTARDRLLDCLRRLNSPERAALSSRLGEGGLLELKGKAFDWLLTESLQDAARLGNVNLLLMLAASGADAARRGALGQSLLMDACGAGRAEAVRELIQWGFDVNERDNWGASPLRAAVLSGAGMQACISFKLVFIRAGEARGFEALDALIEGGADVNATKPDGSTTLSELCGAGDVSEDAVRALLERGARVDGGWIGRSGEPAKAPWNDLPAGKPCSKLCALLLAYGARPDPWGEGQKDNPEALSALESWELNQGSRLAGGGASPRL